MKFSEKRKDQTPRLKYFPTEVKWDAHNVAEDVVPGNRRSRRAFLRARCEGATRKFTSKRLTQDEHRRHRNRNVDALRRARFPVKSATTSDEVPSE